MKSRRLTTWICALCLAASTLGPAWGQAVESKTVPPEQLNASIDEVLKKREFTWRMPREPAPEEEAALTEKTLFARFVEDLSVMMKKVGKAIIRVMKKIDRWLDRVFPDKDTTKVDSGDYDLTWQEGVRVLMFLLLATTSCVLAILLYRRIRQGRAGPSHVMSATPKIAVNIEDPDVPADTLPSNEWLVMAEAFLKEGNGRLAIRAFFLAGLSHLASENRLTLLKSKSNRDYTTELIRHDHDRPDIIEAFRQQTGTLECVWYGTHQATPDLLERARSHCMTLLRYRLAQTTTHTSNPSITAGSS